MTVDAKQAAPEAPLAEATRPVELSNAPENAMASKLKSFLESHRGERHVVVLHDFPDPDAISAGLAHQRISGAYGITADIIYGGRISHQQNIAMVRLLNIELEKFKPNTDLSQYDGAVFVDHQGTSAQSIAQALSGANVPTLAIVDHHEKQEVPTAEFTDIRPKIGASATLYAEYIQHGIIELKRGEAEDAALGTALMHGIMTDTAEFSRATSADFQAAAFLSSYREPELLEEIMSQARSRKVMEVIKLALESRIVTHSFSVASIGYLRADDRDAIPQAADFLLTEENIHTAIVYGLVTNSEGEESIVGSFRTTKITVDPDNFIKETFGTNWDGAYYGGGKPSAGAFEIPIRFLAGFTHNDEYKQLKWLVYDTQIKQKLYAKIGVDEPDS